MSDLWRRLQQACERLRPHLPRGGLNPPATEAQIRTVEKLVGYRFPDELREAYRHFNGAAPPRLDTTLENRCPRLLLQFDWSDLATLARNWVMLRTIEDRTPPPEPTGEPWTQPQRDGYHHPGWLPVGHSDCGHWLAADLDPTRHGRVGQLLSVDMEIEVIAPSLEAYLERLPDALDEGRIRFDLDGWQWVDAAGAAVYDLTAVTGPWPPAIPGGARRRVKAQPAPLPVAPPHPAAFAELGRSLHATLAAMLHAGQTMPVRGTHAEQIEHAQAVLGRRLPLEAAACWSVLDGARGRYPDVWFSLKEATLTYQDWETWVALETHLAEGLPSDDGAVRPGPWRAGWIPVGDHHGRLFCLDLDPGPAGTPGQLIKIERPSDGAWQGRPSAAPRRLADGLAPWLWQVATGADSPAGFHDTPAGAAWRALQHPPDEAVPLVAPAWSALGWEPDPAVEGPTPFFTRRWRVFKSLQHEHAGTSLHHLIRSFPPGSSATPMLDKWISGRADGRALVVAPIGAGTSSLLRHAYAKMRRAWQADSRQPLPLLIDAAPHAGVTSLQGLLEAEAARRGASAAGLLQALAQGRCALIVDHVEALLPSWPTVWTAGDAVPDACARVLFACASEVFTSMAELSRAFDAFAAWNTAGVRRGWLAVHTHESNPQNLHPTLCRKLGFKPEANSWTLQGLGDLSARLGFLVPAACWCAQPGDARPRAMQAWWQQLAARQPWCSAQAFVALVQEALLLRWQPADPLPGGHAEGLRPWLCAAFGVSTRELPIEHAEGERMWPLVQAMEAGDDGDFLALVQRLLDGRPAEEPLLGMAAAGAWFGLGHAEPWCGAARLLLQPQPPRVAGFLLALGWSMAWLAPRPQSRWEANVDRICRLTLPHPLSLAQSAGADLRGQAFMDARLEDLDLRGATLDDADLANARLQGARLDGASLRATRLTGAQLQGASLSGALAVDGDWSHADLCDVIGTDFRAECCDLRGARWNGRWPGATFVDCQLTDDAHPGSHGAPPEVGLLPPQAAAPWSSAAVSPCGRFVAVAGAQRTLSLHDVHSLQPLWCARAWAGAVRQLCFDAEGRHLFGLLQYGDLVVWQTVDGQFYGHDAGQWQRRATLAEHIGALRWDPVRARPATLSDRGFEWYSGEWGGSASDCGSLRIHPSPRWRAAVFAGPPAVVVAAQADGVDILPSQGTDPVEWASHGLKTGSVTWGPRHADALDLAPGPMRDALLAVRAGPVLTVGALMAPAALWAAPVSAEHPPHFSPCNRWLACGPTLFDVATGQPHPLPGPVLAFGPDGRPLIATADGGRYADLPA